MENKYFKNTFRAFLIVAILATVLPAFAKSISFKSDSLTKATLKFKDNRPNRPVFNNAFKTDFDAFMYKMTTLKTGLSNTDNSNTSSKTQNAKSVSNVNLDLQKPIDNVKVYPNPVSDQLNLSYSLKKESLVTIKILDVLGNDVATLLNQKLNAGYQNNKFMIDSKLNSGFYFVRIIAGSDSIVKRISVL